MKQLIRLILVVGLIHFVGSEASESTLAKPADEKAYEYYVDEMFELQSRFHRLPRDIQFLILSYLPSPFRPVHPKNVRELLYEELALGTTITALPPTLTRSGKEVLIVGYRSYLLEPLDGSYRSEPIPFPIPCVNYALNDDHTKMVIVSQEGICELRLNDDYAIVASMVVDLPDIKEIQWSKVKYLSDESILLVSGYKEIVRWEPGTSTFEKLTTTPASEAYYTTRYFAIHPQGRNVVYCDGAVLSIFDVATREWGVVEGLELASSSNLRSVSYNSDGSSLLVKELYESPHPFSHKPGFSYRSEYRVLKLDTTGEKILEILWLVEVDRNSAYTSDDKFFYVGGDEKFSTWDMPKGKTDEYAYDLLRIFSSKTNRCLLAMFSNDRTEHVLIDSLWRYIVSVNGKKVRIWEVNPVWSDADVYMGRSNLLRQDIFVRYLHFLGRYGLTLSENGLCAQPKYANRFTLVEGGPTQEEMGQLLETYNSFEEPEKEYFYRKYGALSLPEGTKLNQGKLLKLLTFAAIIGYAGSIMKNRYTSKKQNNLGSRTLGDLLVEEHNEKDQS